MIQVDKYLGREFDLRKFNCWDLAREVWLDHCGIDIGPRDFPTPTRRDMTRAMNEQFPKLEAARVLREVPYPEDPCVVLFQRPGLLSHAGVYTKGRILHIQPQCRVLHENLDNVLRVFTSVRFFVNAETHHHH